MWYRVDAVDRVSEVSPDWMDHARRGGAPGLVPETVIGRPIWSFFEGEKTCFHFAHIFETTRQTGLPAQLRLRSDGPGRQSLLEMTISRHSGQSLDIRVETLRDRAVAVSPLWNWSLQRSSDLVIACSFCKSIEIDQTWLPLLEAEQIRRDLKSHCPPEVVHHLCPTCDRTLQQERKLAFA